MAQVLEMISVSIFPKNLYSRNLTLGLSVKEFQCKCDRDSCHYTMVASSLLTSYWKVRYAMKMRLHINSGFRCQAHNEEEGGSDTSSHTTGHAIDISTENSFEEETRKLIELAVEHFDFVKVYPKFIHCHNEGEAKWPVN